jgi:hypothetical protein
MSRRPEARGPKLGYAFNRLTWATVTIAHHGHKVRPRHGGATTERPSADFGEDAQETRVGGVAERHRPCVTAACAITLSVKYTETGGERRAGGDFSPRRRRAQTGDALRLLAPDGFHVEGEGRTNVQSVPPRTDTEASDDAARIVAA